MLEALVECGLLGKPQVGLTWGVLSVGLLRAVLSMEFLRSPGLGQMVSVTCPRRRLPGAGHGTPLDRPSLRSVNSSRRLG